MKSKKIVGLVLMVIFTINVFFTMPQIMGAVETQQISIVDTINDGFVTETGNWFYDVPFVTITDPDMGTFAYVTFRDLEINRWEYLINATLRLFMAGQYSPDPNSKVTIYGVKINNFQGFSNAGEVMSAPLTVTNIVYNTSAFTGQNFVEIDVTEIVRELYSTVTWTGDGHSGTDDKDNMGFMFLSASGYDTRAFYGYSPTDSLGPRLEIFWGEDEAPPPPPPPGPDPPTVTFNESQRGFVIWEVDYNGGENRTGTPQNATAVNWALLNQSDLSEADSGARVVVNNATWNTATSLRAQEVMSLYNDTGGLGINTFFVRFAINVTDLDNTQAATWPVVALCGISTLTPAGSDGHAFDNDPGEWVGLVLGINADDVRYHLYLRERQWLNTANSGTSQWFTSNTNQTLYIEFRMKHFDGDQFIMYRVYDDPGFTNLIEDHSYQFISAGAPFRYPQILASAGPILGNEKYWGEFYTYLSDPVTPNVTWTVTYENGTVITGGDDLDSYDDALVFIDDVLGADPSEPDPPGQDWEQTGPFQRFSVRLYLLLIGFFLIFGPLVVSAMRRPSAYEAVIGALIILVGFALMYAAGQV